MRKRQPPKPKKPKQDDDRDALARAHGRFPRLPLRARQFKHVLESALSRGATIAAAEELAARVTNKQRARSARAEGPQLVSRGGSRRQWYPGKRLGDPSALLVCLMHRSMFKSKAGLYAHYRSRAHTMRRMRAAPTR